MPYKRINDWSEYIQHIHYEWAVPKGWWSDLDTGKRKERCWGELCTLVHSELSEAMEADRKDLPDDKLPQFPGSHVEMADAVIRICDMAGGFALTLEAVTVEIAEDRANSWLIGNIHTFVSMAFSADDVQGRQYHLSMALGHIQHFAEVNEFDLAQMISEKMEFNAHRPDHNVENRRGEHGKKY